MLALYCLPYFSSLTIPLVNKVASNNCSYFFQSLLTSVQNKYFRQKTVKILDRYKCRRKSYRRELSS